MRRLAKELRSRRKGFTLVELLVVVSIIALLISILLPSLKKAREQSKSIVCRTRLRGLAIGAQTYASEFGRFPPSHANYRPNAYPGVGSDFPAVGRDWLGVGGHINAPFEPAPDNDPTGGNPPGFEVCPTRGKLYPYTKNDELYRCPTDRLIPLDSYADQNRGVDTIVSRPGSENWKFSYSMFGNMGMRSPEEGVPPAIITVSPNPLQRIRKKGGAVAPSSVPVFVEEHPDGIGNFRSGHVEGTFNTGVDRLVGRHGPIQRRDGRAPGNASIITKFKQGNTNIAFADSHVANVPVSYGFSYDDIEGGRRVGIPDRAEELLKFYGIQYQEIWVTPGGGLKYQTVQTE